ncbi:MAG: GGDEF domain-containing protein [Eubacteriales bacterium]|nr:GGDEF domain-containing protein [Eubacteriales bacterium]
MEYLQVNVVCALFLALLLISFRRKSSDIFLSDRRLFEWMLMLNIVILAFDSFTWVLDGSSFSGAKALNRFVTVVYYSLNAGMGLLYLLYCEVKTGVSHQELGRRIVIYLLPVIANIVLSILSLYVPLFFRLDEANRYHRGTHFWLSLLLSYCLVAVAFGLVIVRMRRQGGHSQMRIVYRSLLLFPLPPLLGGLLQVWLMGMPVVWVSTVFSLLIIFINIQNVQITSDPLTGLYNRGQLAPYIKWKVHRITAGHDLFLIMLDLDDFKSINDRCGHLTGNEALIYAASCLNTSCAHGDFITRYGGDEFIVIAERESEEQIQALMARIQEQATRVDALRNAPYTLSFSMGFSRWSTSQASPERFIGEADRKMYACKVEKKIGRAN